MAHLLVSYRGLLVGDKVKKKCAGLILCMNCPPSGACWQQGTCKIENLLAAHNSGV